MEREILEAVGDAVLTAAVAPKKADQPRRSGARKGMELFVHIVFLLCGIVAVAFVLFISIYLIISGLPAIRTIGLKDFLLGEVWAPTATTVEPSYGILPFILTSVYGTAGAVVIGVPVGLMTAMFLAKVAPPKAAAVIRTAVELLAGEPGPYTVVGDMTHDYDMARALGADCILVAAGHQSRPVLERCGVPVLESLWELPALLHSGGDPAKGREAAQ